MEREEIGKFYATSFNGFVFEFIVYSDNTMACPILNINSFNKMIIKPRFVLSGNDFMYIYNSPSKEKDKNPQNLIENYNIDDDLFDYLKQNGMITYSNDMAYLYGFEDKYGYDSEANYYGVGSPYKWAKKKGPILSKQKKGQFN